MESNKKSSTKSTKRYPCTYEGCKSSFPRPSKLNLHLKIHQGEIPFKCDVEGCSKAYSTKSHLKRHTEIKHEKVETKTKCSFEGCLQEFSNKSNMQRHIKRIHNPSRTFYCKECNQQFNKKKNLHDHSYLHTGVYYYKCEICADGFPTMNDYKKHKKYNSHKIHQCDKCPEKFTKWSEFRKHKCIHTPIFKCTECHYKTMRKVLFSDHRATHMEQSSRRKYSCSYTDCKRTYFYARNLRLHVKRFHEGIKKKIPCSVAGCKAQLSKMTCLKRHIQVVHSSVPRIKVLRPRHIRKDCGTHKKKVVYSLIPRIKCN